MRAYVINLVRSPERRRYMTTQLTKYGIDFEIIEAVDGRELDMTDPSVIAAIAPSFLSASWFLPSHSACAMSHINAHRKIVADGLDYGLVLEDDIIIPADLSEMANAVASHMSGAGVALLNFDSPGTNKMSRKDSRELPASRQLVFPLDVSKPPVSGAAYVITREACERMIERAFPIHAKADDWARHYREGAIDSIRCVVPMAVIKNPSFASTIGYNSDGSFKARVLQIILEYDLQILQRVIAFRRRRIWQKYTKVEFEDDPRSLT